MTLVLCLDYHAALIRNAMISAGLVLQPRLAPRVLPTWACHRASCVGSRYGRDRGRKATEQERHSHGSTAQARSCYEHPVVRQVVVPMDGNVR